MIPLKDTIPSRHLPVMTWSLIGVNILVFIYQVSLPEPALRQLVYLFGIVPARYTDPLWAAGAGLPAAAPWPFLTSMFLHGGFFHLLSNMWTLWIFGDNVEDRMGPVRFLVFYLLCGAISGVVHGLTNLNSQIPTIGASGAIAGVLGAYFVLYPAARVLTMFLIVFWPVFVELPAFIYLALWFVTQLLSGSISLAGGVNAGGIAWWAHVGGFLAGLLLFRRFLRRRSAPSRAAWM